MINDTLAGKRMFLIEDDVDQIMMITNVLAFYGVSVSCNLPGKDVICCLTQRLPIDLILLDLMLPQGVTGYTVLTRIRSHSWLHDIPVVAVSALDPAIEIPKAKEAGFAGFVAKPIVLKEIASQLLDVLNGQLVWISDSRSTVRG
jgi:CheY-like chemotaxis protein